MENVFESCIFNSEKEKPITWFLKQKDRLSDLHPDMYDSMINMKILRKYGGELEHDTKRKCIEPCSAEDLINSMKDIITRNRIGQNWTRTPIESRIIPKTPMEEKRSDRPILKCNTCGRTSNLANNCTNKTKINKLKTIEEVKFSEEKRNLKRILQFLTIHQCMKISG
ncbi:hypothetical protein O181_060811 [Austropuccinia psidii MF-1]|uniref:Uncharacterized protein n=1 Tax=Austropuccinia psidii MF-1 TaxID=1389203 RepID=A0A9Q3HWY3_9BASI|nr:hypothetical protein [Austropuccinia psidii MF-1]